MMLSCQKFCHIQLDFIWMLPIFLLGGCFSLWYGVKTKDTTPGFLLQQLVDHLAHMFYHHSQNLAKNILHYSIWWGRCRGFYQGFLLQLLVDHLVHMFYHYSHNFAKNIFHYSIWWVRCREFYTEPWSIPKSLLITIFCNSFCLCIFCMVIYL